MESWRVQRIIIDTSPSVRELTRENNMILWTDISPPEETFPTGAYFVVRTEFLAYYVITDGFVAGDDIKIIGDTRLRKSASMVRNKRVSEHQVLVERLAAIIIRAKSEEKK